VRDILQEDMGKSSKSCLVKGCMGGLVGGI